MISISTNYKVVYAFLAGKMINFGTRLLIYIIKTWTFLLNTILAKLFLSMSLILQVFQKVFLVI